MASVERTAYPRFGRNPSKSELTRLYMPTLRELELARRATRGNEQRALVFLAMLKSFQRLGYFPKPGEVPEAVLSQIGSRLDLNHDLSSAPPLAPTLPGHHQATSPSEALRR